VRPWKANGHWVIAKNFRPIDAEGIFGIRPRSNRSRIIHDSWTGSWWAKPLFMARKFPTQEAAQACIDEHYERLAEFA